MENLIHIIILINDILRLVRNIWVLWRLLRTIAKWLGYAINIRLDSIEIVYRQFLVNDLKINSHVHLYIRLYISIEIGGIIIYTCMLHIRVSKETYRDSKK